MEAVRGYHISPLQVADSMVELLHRTLLTVSVYVQRKYPVIINKGAGRDPPGTPPFLSG
jgi:hypothetical protein